MTPIFHLFVSDVDQRNGGVGWVQDDLAWSQKIISRLKNKANKTKDPADIKNYKKQRNYVATLNKEAKLEYFSNLNLMTMNHFG